MTTTHQYSKIAVRARLRSVACGLVALLTIAVPAAARADSVVLPPIDPAALNGVISVGGSITVNLMTDRVADQFTKAGFKGAFIIAKESTGEGIRRFCAGEVDVATTMSAMTEEQIAICKKNGRPVVEIPIGVDALVFTVSRRNTFVTNLTRKNLADIYAGRVTIWSQIDPTWPASPIRPMSQTPDLAGYDFVSDQLFKSSVPDTVARKAIIKSVSGMAMFDKPQKVAVAVQADDFAVGYVAYAFYAQNRTRLRTVPFETVMANDRTVAAKAYALTRTGRLLVSPAVLKAKPQVNAFVNFYLLNSQQVAPTVGFFPEPDASHQEARRLYLSAQ
jgi:phosphate transport system substrate-binding protein